MITTTDNFLCPKLVSLGYENIKQVSILADKVTIATLDNRSSTATIAINRNSLFLNLLEACVNLKYFEITISDMTATKDEILSILKGRTETVNRITNLTLLLITNDSETLKITKQDFVDEIVNDVRTHSNTEDNETKPNVNMSTANISNNSNINDELQYDEATEYNEEEDEDTEYIDEDEDVEVDEDGYPIEDDVDENVPNNTMGVSNQQPIVNSVANEGLGLFDAYKNAFEGAVALNKIETLKWKLFFEKDLKYDLNIGNPTQSMECDFIAVKRGWQSDTYIFRTPSLVFKKFKEKEAMINNRLAPGKVYKLSENYKDTSGVVAIEILRDPQFMNKKLLFKDVYYKRGVFANADVEIGNMKKVIVGVTPTSIETLNLLASGTNHILAAGGSGSGKTVLMHAVLLQAMSAKFMPIFFDANNAGAYLYRKYGIYTAAGNDEILEKFDKIYSLFEYYKKKIGPYQYLTVYNRENPTEQLPNVIFTFDEFQSFSNKCSKGKDSKKNPYDKVLMGISDISAQGRKFGWHVMLGTQTPSADYFTKGLVTNLAVRFMGVNTDKYFSFMQMSGIEAVPPNTSDQPNRSTGKFAYSQSRSTIKSLYISVGEDTPEDDDLTDIINEIKQNVGLINAEDYINLMKSEGFGNDESELSEDGQEMLSADSFLGSINKEVEETENLFKPSTNNFGSTVTGVHNVTEDISNMQGFNSNTTSQPQSTFVTARTILESANSDENKETKLDDLLCKKYPSKTYYKNVLTNLDNLLQDSNREPMLCERNSCMIQETGFYKVDRPLVHSNLEMISVPVFNLEFWGKNVFKPHSWLGSRILNSSYVKKKRNKRDTRNLLVTVSIDFGGYSAIKTLDFIRNHILFNGQDYANTLEIDIRDFDITQLSRLDGLEVLGSDDTFIITKVIEEFGLSIVDDLFNTFRNLKSIQICGRELTKSNKKRPTEQTDYFDADSYVKEIEKRDREAIANLVNNSKINEPVNENIVDSMNFNELTETIDTTEPVTKSEQVKHKSIEEDEISTDSIAQAHLINMDLDKVTENRELDIDSELNITEEDVITTVTSKEYSKSKELEDDLVAVTTLSESVEQSESVENKEIIEQVNSEQQTNKTDVNDTLTETIKQDLENYNQISVEEELALSSNTSIEKDKYKKVLEHDSLIKNYDMNDSILGDLND